MKSAVWIMALAAVAFPIGAQWPVKIYAQHLVDEVVARNPDVVLLALHAKPPRGDREVVLASNFGRIGEDAGEGVVRAMRTGRTLAKVLAGANRFETQLPLRDVSGGAIGALAVDLRYAPGDDEVALRARAEAIRDGLKRRITYASNLVEPYPMDPRATTKTYAQKLVDDLLIRHPDLLIVALHVTPPGWKDNIIVASNIGRIGKKADADDMQVLSTGKPVTKPHGKGDRFHVELVLEDAYGKSIGALGLVFPYNAKESVDAIVKRAHALRDELGARIPSLERLVELDP